jgi:acyl-CoA thioester hydrolase
MPEPDGGSAPWPHREQLRVRYQEVDLQNVVFNAHYLGWCDVACAEWMRQAVGWTGVGDDVDWMLVKVQMEWQGSATYGDTVDLDCGIARWGTTSFDVAYRGTVDGRAVFTATITYVCIEPGTTSTTPVPAVMRGALAPVPS